MRDSDFKKELKSVEKKIVTDIVKLQKIPNRVTENDVEEISAFLKDADIFFKGHPKAQGIAGKQFGYPLDIMAIPGKDGTQLYGNIKVNIPLHTPKTPHDEGDYSFGGRYKVNRAIKCIVSGVKIVFQEGKIKFIAVLDATLEKDRAYVFQHLAEMNAGVFIISGRRTHIFDRAR